MVYTVLYIAIYNVPALVYLFHVEIQQTVTNSGVLTSNWIWGIHRCRVARHNTPAMFLNGIDFPVNFLNPGVTKTRVMHIANTHSVHAQLMPICRDTCHVVFIQSSVMKLVQTVAVPYYIYYMRVCWKRRGWVTGGAMPIILSDLIENMRIASALQIKPLNSVSPFRLFYLAETKQKWEMLGSERLRKRTKVEQRKEDRLRLSPN